MRQTAMRSLTARAGTCRQWAEDDPRHYWAAADAHERVNGRLFVAVEFALPKELNEAQQRTLARSFAAELTGGERLPYTMALRRGGGENPHVRLMISERALDGHDRDAERWFKRYNRKAPEKGGARKTRSIKGKEWLENTRRGWARAANRALEEAGRAERIDHRSLEAQRAEALERGELDRAAELARIPGIHLGAERYRAARGGHSRVVRDGRGRSSGAIAWIERNSPNTGARSSARKRRSGIWSSRYGRWTQKSVRRGGGKRGRGFERGRRRGSRPACNGFESVSGRGRKRGNGWSGSRRPGRSNGDG